VNERLAKRGQRRQTRAMKFVLKKTPKASSGEAKNSLSDTAGKDEAKNSLSDTAAQIPGKRVPKRLRRTPRTRLEVQREKKRRRGEGEGDISSTPPGPPMRPPQCAKPPISKGFSEHEAVAEEAVSVAVSTQETPALSVFDEGPVDMGAEQKELSKLPVFSCNSCSVGPDCPEYKPGYVCAFNKSFAAIPLRNSSSALALMKEVVERNKQRFRRAILTEELVNGGMLDPQVTGMSQVLMQQTRELVELARQTRTVSVTMAGTPQNGGILSRLFGAAEKVTNEVELNPVNGRTAETPYSGAVLDTTGETVKVHGDAATDSDSSKPTSS